MRVEGLGLATLGVAGSGAVLAALGGAASGSAAALGAGLGALLVVVFFSFGALSVNLVATVAPKASMLVALMTYTLQVLLLALVLVALARSDLAPGTIDPRWLGGSVLVGTLVWMSALVVGTVRAGVAPVESAPGETSHAGEVTR